MTKNKPGIKNCPRCDMQHGARKVLCECGFKFTIMIGATKRARKRRGEPVDWKTLEPNDYIRVRKGPYFETEDEPISMGYSGLFKVRRLSKEGIQCFPLGKDTQYSGIIYLYMGELRISEDTGTVLRPHKVTKVEAKYALKEPV